MDDYSPQGPAVPLARALVDSSPNPYDKDALRFKVNPPNKLLSTNHENIEVNRQQAWFYFILFKKCVFCPILERRYYRSSQYEYEWPLAGQSS